MKEKEKEFKLILMEEDMTVNGKMAKSVDLASTLGMMDKFIKEIGVMMKEMAKGF
jgi:ribosomal protein S4E